MKAAIIAVGNEVVTGHTVNSNATYIARQIQSLGIKVTYHCAVCDEREAIEAALEGMKKGGVHYIFLTGGLGPTEDDLTKEVVCKALGFTTEINKEVLEQLEMYFKVLGRKMSANNKKQATFPKEAYLLLNDHGTAPGCILEKEGVSYILLPGPPREMKTMLDHYVVPYLKRQTKACCESIDIKLFGIGESELAERISDLLGEYTWGNVAPYIDVHEVIVRITSWAEEDVAKTQANKVKKEIENRLEDFIFGYNEDSLETLLIHNLKERGQTVATVESCTGGMLASAFVSCDGASNCFNEGIVTYSNAAKMKYVKVKEATLQSYGAVSSQTAIEMAEGIRAATKADIGLSTTGIAGPGGGTPEKPVGLVYIGIALADQTYVYELHLKGTRTVIREKTVKNILFQLYKLLK